MSAKYLLPKRGSKDVAQQQHVLLKSGELFLEFPTGMTGKEPGRIVIGDGNTQYQNINYASTATNEFQPFITDPSIYIPRFDDSTPDPQATATYDWNATTKAIDDIGDGSVSNNVKLPNVVGSIKKSLTLLLNGLANINKSKYDKYDSVIINNNGIKFAENTSDSTVQTSSNGIEITDTHYDTDLYITGEGIEFNKKGSSDHYFVIDKSGIKSSNSRNFTDFIYINDGDINRNYGWGDSDTSSLNLYLENISNKDAYADCGSRNYQPSTSTSTDLETYDRFRLRSGERVIVFFNGAIKISENTYDNYASLTLKYKKSSSSDWIVGAEYKCYQSTFQTINGIAVLNLEKDTFYDFKLCLEANGTGTASVKTATSDYGDSWAIVEI